MTATIDRSTTTPFRAGSAVAALEAVRRRVHAFTATWWYVPLANLARVAAALRERLRAWWSWRNTRATLLAQDDRTLEDIGLNRQDLLRIGAAELNRCGRSDEVLRRLYRLHC